MKIAIEKTMVLSTGHISSEDNDLLSKTIKHVKGKITKHPYTERDYPYKVVDHGDGYIIYVPTGTYFSESNSEGYITKLEPSDWDIIVLKGFSSAFKKILNLAISNDCCWVNLDAGADIYEDLEEFEW